MGVIFIYTEMTNAPHLKTQGYCHREWMQGVNALEGHGHEVLATALIAEGVDDLAMNGTATDTAGLTGERATFEGDCGVRLLDDLQVRVDPRGSTVRVNLCDEPKPSSEACEGTWSNYTKQTLQHLCLH